MISYSNRVLCYYNKSFEVLHLENNYAGGHIPEIVGSIPTLATKYNSVFLLKNIFLFV